MAAVDDIIGQWVREVERSGELRGSAAWGRPLDLDDGFSETPEPVRMAYKVLKNAGFAPPELQLFRSLDALRHEVAAATGDSERARLRGRLAEVRLKLALLRERGRRTR